MNDKYYITTAIVYVNAKPHVGFADELIRSDASARFQRMCGRKVFFLTGMDEHSANAEKVAQTQGKETMAYCDEMAAVYERLYVTLDLSNDDYIRTTEPRHAAAVREMLQRSYDNGDIYTGKYSGYYCESCEAFYPEKELVEERCPVHGTEPKWLEEENYFFRWSAYTERLKALYTERPDFPTPSAFRNEMLALLETGLEDISISRSTTQWGIRLPWDEKHVAYVWFDALTNYLTATGFPDASYTELWPADTHVIGKDITRFHALLWPAMLMSAGVEVPKQVFVHGFLTSNGQKMSKTLGNVVDPFEIVERYNLDALRYALLKDIRPGADGDFSMESMVGRHNTDLANNFGNLVNRTLSMLKKYRGGIVPQAPRDGEIEAEAQPLLDEYMTRMNALDPQAGLTALMRLADLGNGYIVQVEPWGLAKDEAKATRLDTVMRTLVDLLAASAYLLYPAVPGKALELLKRCGIEAEGSVPVFKGQFSEIDCQGNTTEVGTPLFPRLEDE